MSKIFSIVSRFIEDFVRKLNYKNIFPISLVPLFNHRTTDYFLINLSHLGKHFEEKRVNSFCSSDGNSYILNFEVKANRKSRFTSYHGNCFN